MRPKKFLRDTRIGFAGLVNHHGHQEGRVIRHVVQPPRGQVPLATEVALGPRVGVGGYQRYEQCAVVDLLLDLCVPSIAPAQFAPVEPHFNARFAQGFADARSSFGILGRVGQENSAGRARWLSHVAAKLPIRSSRDP